MDLSEWEEHFGFLLEREVDSCLDEHADQLFRENPLKSRKLQREQMRMELLRMFRLEEATELIDRALPLLSTLLPQRVLREEWESCLEEFLSCDEALIAFFEKDAAGEIPPDQYIPIHLMLGLSTNTLKHCYELGGALYRERNFDDARCLFGFLISIAPHRLEFWIALAMCYEKMGQSQEAIATYTVAEALFKGEPSLHIHLANQYITGGDLTHARIQLDEVKKTFIEFPEKKAGWEQAYEYLCSRSG